MNFMSKTDGLCLTYLQEVSRTYTFGEHGSSQGQFYSEFLKPIQLNDDAHKVDWSSIDLGAQLGKRHYDEELTSAVRFATFKMTILYEK